MDARWKSFLGKAKTTAATAYCRAEDLVEQGKLNLKLGDIEREIDEAYKVIGALVYQANSDPELDTTGINDIIAKIDLLRGDAAELREKIGELKKTRKCPSCGRDCPKTDAYCPACGTKLD
jgi:polyhydroxyalkanoate synthesis regulator phasin